jgi:long-subunit acyl-CoA synthetase (AMP-forming)
MTSVVQGDASVLRPTVMCAVPLVLDRIYKGVKSNIRKKGEFTSLLMDFCYNYRSRIFATTCSSSLRRAGSG